MFSQCGNIAQSTWSLAGRCCRTRRRRARACSACRWSGRGARCGGRGYPCTITRVTRDTWHNTHVTLTPCRTPGPSPWRTRRSGSPGSCRTSAALRRLGNRVLSCSCRDIYLSTRGGNEGPHKGCNHVECPYKGFLLVGSCYYHTIKILS